MERNASTQKRTRQKKRAAKKNKVAIRKAGYVPVMPKFGLSSCARLYLHALTNPFVPLSTAEMPCIPDLVTLPSHKIYTLARGTMTIGTDGLGFVLVDPFTMISNTAASIGAITSYPVLYTTGTYANNSINWHPIGGVLPAGLLGALPNSPYTAATAPLSTGQVRLVGCGLRVRYSGNELYRGGTVTLYRSQGNLNVTNTATIPTLLQSPLSAMAPVNRGWHSVTYLPDESTELEYHGYGQYWDVTQGAAASHHSLLIAVQTPLVPNANVQQTFDFEVAAYFELIGSNLSLTSSHADPVGIGAIRSVVSTAKLSTQSPEVQEKSFMSQIMSGAWENISGTLYSAGSQAIAHAGKAAINTAFRAATGVPLAIMN